MGDGDGVEAPLLFFYLDLCITTVLHRVGIHFNEFAFQQRLSFLPSYLYLAAIGA